MDDSLDLRAREASRRGTPSRIGRLVRAWPRLSLALTVVALVLVHVASLGYGRYASVDEGYASAIAARLQGGAILYDGAISQRGPLLYYVFLTVARLTSWTNIYAIRVATLAVQFGLLATVGWVVRRTLRSMQAVAIAVAAMAYPFVFGLPPYDGLALHGETILAPLLLLAAAWGLPSETPGPRDRVRLFAAGAAVGVAICVKQTAAVNLLPILAITAYAARRAPRNVALGRLLLPCIGAALPVLAVILLALRAGVLKQVVYYTITYNATIHVGSSSRIEHLMTIVADAFLAPVLIFAIVVALACAMAWPRDKGRYRGPYFAAHFTVSFVLAALIPQRFPHYFTPSLAFLAVLLGGAWRVLQPRTPQARRIRQRIAIASVAVGALAALSIMQKRLGPDGRVAHAASVEWVAKKIERETKPDDKIFVWGFSPWLYGYSHRRPAGRFVFGTYVTGFVPWNWDELDLEHARVVPGSMGQLLGDLDREQPAMVIDAGNVQIGRAMRAYPEMDTWIKAHYCFAWRLGAFDAYTRRAPGETCPVSCLPRPAPPVDYFDMPMVIRAPSAVDDAASADVKGPFAEARSITEDDCPVAKSTSKSASPK